MKVKALKSLVYSEGNGKVHNLQAGDVADIQFKNDKDVEYLSAIGTLEVAGSTNVEAKVSMKFVPKVEVKKANVGKGKKKNK